MYCVTVALWFVARRCSGEKIFNETTAQKEQRLKWWADARFGMFIHWGLYSLPARHEWVIPKNKPPYEVPVIELSLK